MDDILKELYQRDTAGIEKTFKQFKESIESEMVGMDKREVLISRLSKYYEKELKVEDKYAKSIQRRLEKIKKIDNLSGIEIDLLKQTLEADLKLLRQKELGIETTTTAKRPGGRGGGGGGPEHSFEEKINYSKMASKDLANQLMVIEKLSGEGLFDKLAEVPKFARLSKKSFRTLYEEIEAIGKPMADIAERTETAKKSFMEFADEKVFSKFDGLIDSSASKMLGLQKPLQNMKDKIIGQLGTKFEGMFSKALLPGLEGATAGAGTFGIAMGAALLPILAIVAAVAAIGFVLYKMYDVWKQYKETTIEIQKQYGLVAERAEKLTAVTKELYMTNGNLALSLEDSKETVNALYGEFLNVNSVTKELAQQSINYQKAYGFSADEAAEILKTNKIIFGLSDAALKAQDDHIVKYSGEIGFSAKEMKRLYADATLVSKIGYENIDKMARLAADAKMSFEDIKGLSEIFELGEFSDSIQTANKLLRSGIQVDPLALQFKLNEGDLAGVTNDILSAFKASGKDLSKLKGIDRKMLADALGGEEKYLEVMKAQAALKQSELTTGQKLANLQTASFDDLLNQTTQLDQIGGMWATIKRVFESIVARFAPAMEAFMKGFQEGIKPLVEGFAKANTLGEGLFGPEAIKRIVSFGVGVAKVVAGLVHAFEFITTTFSMVYSSISMTWNILKGLYYWFKTEFWAMLWPFAKMIDFIFKTDLSAGIESSMSDALSSSGEAFKAAGSSFVEGVSTDVGALGNLAANAGLVAGKDDKIKSKEDDTKALLAATQENTAYLKALAEKTHITEISMNGKKLGQQTSKSGKV